MRLRRLQIRATPEELARWEKAAEQETLSLSTWARRELERASRQQAGERTEEIVRELRGLDSTIRRIAGESPKRIDSK